MPKMRFSRRFENDCEPLNMLTRQTGVLSYGMIHLFLFFLLLSLPLSYVACNQNHFLALKTIETMGGRIEYRRNQPTPVDKFLGRFRFDQVKNVSYEPPDNIMSVGDYGDMVQNISEIPSERIVSDHIARAVSHLRSLDEYDDSAVMALDLSVGFLEPIAGSIRKLHLENSRIDDPRHFFSAFTNLQKFTFYSRKGIDLGFFDCNWLPSPEKLVSLELHSLNTPTIVNLQLCKNLKELDLTSPDLRMIPTEVLNTLETLRISDWTPTPIECQRLGQLRNLKVLDIGRSKIESLSSLTSLKRLYSLAIYRSEIMDMPDLSDMDLLTYIVLEETSIKDVNVFANMKSLRTLIFDGYPGHTIRLQRLGDLPQLTDLGIGFATINDSDLVGCSRLETVWFENCVVSPETINRLTKNHLRLEVIVQHRYQNTFTLNPVWRKHFRLLFRERPYLHPGIESVMHYSGGTSATESNQARR